jgi:hypothetical protein
MGSCLRLFAVAAGGHKGRREGVDSSSSVRPSLGVYYLRSCFKTARLNSPAPELAPLLRCRTRPKIAISKHQSIREVLRHGCLLKVLAWVRDKLGDTEGDSYVSRTSRISSAQNHCTITIIMQQQAVGRPGHWSTATDRNCAEICSLCPQRPSRHQPDSCAELQPGFHPACQLSSHPRPRPASCAEPSYPGPKLEPPVPTNLSCCRWTI